MLEISHTYGKYSCDLLHYSPLNQILGHVQPSVPLRVTDASRKTDIIIIIIIMLNGVKCYY